MKTFVTAVFCVAVAWLPARASKAPYSSSSLFTNIAWDWTTYTTAAPGSDLWPITWGPDDNLYAAWGDGGGFGGSDTDGRVALGFARLEGRPEHFRGFNVNGGKNPEHAASFPRRGKTSGILFLDDVLYASINLQDGPWPNVSHVLAWSTNKAANWTQAPWLFEKGAGHFQPAKFLTSGRDYGGALSDFVFLYGPRQSSGGQRDTAIYLARVPRHKLRERAAYEFWKRGTEDSPAWVRDVTEADAVFRDPNGASPAGVGYYAPLKRYLLTSFHLGPGQLGVFEGPTPWGPWATVAYYEDWGRMGAEGEGLTCGFPQKWTSADGLTLWCVFSVYGDGAKKGIHAHDKFNLVKATLERR